MNFKKQLTLIVETDDDTILDDLNKLANLCEEVRNTCFTIKRKINCKATDEKKKDFRRIVSKLFQLFNDMFSEFI